MSDDIELLTDGNGLAVIGNSSAVDRFLSSTGLVPKQEDAGAVMRWGAVLAQSGSDFADHTGRWVKLTADSAEKVKRYGWMPTDKPGISHAMLGPRGDIKSWVQIDNASTMLTNPAFLAGAAGIMTQLAMQQQMQMIQDYLVRIDAKLDSVLRSQTNEVLARLDGVALAVAEGMSIREAVGRVSEVTWSKVQASSSAIHETQGYALRQLADTADDLEAKANIGDLLDAVKSAAKGVQTWLAALARSFELHDAVGVLELDRVLDASPADLDQHRLGLQSARRERLELINDRTQRLIDRMNGAVDRANSKVLFNPKQSPAIVESGNHVVEAVIELQKVLGIGSGADSFDARAWIDAASEAWTRAKVTSAHGIEDARRLASDALSQADSVKNKLSSRLAHFRKRRND